MSPLHRLCMAAAVCMLAEFAQAEPRTTLADGPTGRFEFRTYTPPGQRSLIARSYLKDPSSVISAELLMPAKATMQRDGRSPAVILAHGTGGISQEREHAWAKRLNGWGIAALIVDSFTGRGLRPPIYADRPGFTHVSAHLVDAYLALQLLATHPRIDGRRVAVMGFSRGGELAVNAIFEPFRAGAIGSAPERFAAYIPFYPYCNFRHASKALATAPMLMLLGGADEMTEPAPCRNMATWLKEQGVPVRVVTFSGAHHAFDKKPPVRRDPSYVGIRACEAVYDLDTMTIRRLDTGAVMATKEANDAWLAECRKRGARFGGDAKALAASIGEVQRFLSEVFAR